MKAGGQRKRLSKVEGQALVEQWRQSGESKEGFCRRTGVGTHVLRYWLGQQAQDTVQSAPEGFVVVQAPRSMTEIETGAQDELTAERRQHKAVLVVLSDATSTLLARTALELLGEVRS